MTVTDWLVIMTMVSFVQLLIIAMLWTDPARKLRDKHKTPFPETWLCTACNTEHVIKASHEIIAVYAKHQHCGGALDTIGSTLMCIPAGTRYVHIPRYDLAPGAKEPIPVRKVNPLRALMPGSQQECMWSAQKIGPHAGKFTGDEDFNCSIALTCRYDVCNKECAA